MMAFSTFSIITSILLTTRIVFSQVESTQTVKLLNHCNTTIDLDFGDNGYVEVDDDGSSYVDCEVTIQCSTHYVISTRLLETDFESCDQSELEFISILGPKPDDQYAIFESQPYFCGKPTSNAIDFDQYGEREWRITHKTEKPNKERSYALFSFSVHNPKDEPQWPPNSLKTTTPTPAANATSASVAPTVMTPSATISTTTASTTTAPTTAAQTTAVPTTAAKTTASQTTTTPTTTVPTTAVPTTAVPTTAVPTTAVPTTAAQTITAPTITVPTTAVPTTAVPTTAVPTTAVPTTAVPTTAVPTTAVPTTATQTITAPTTTAKTTAAPTSATSTVTIPTSTVTAAALTITVQTTTASPTTAVPTSEALTPTIPSMSNATILAKIATALVSATVTQNSTPYTPTIKSKTTSAAKPDHTKTLPETTTLAPTLPAITTTAPVAVVSRRCNCGIRAANAVTNYTFIKKNFDQLLQTDTDDNINMLFKETAECSTVVTQSCAAHCRGIVKFDNGHDTILPSKQSIGDYVCSYLKWTLKYVKVEVTSVISCGRSKGQAKVDITRNLCCLRNKEYRWIGTSCEVKVTPDPNVFG